MKTTLKLKGGGAMRDAIQMDFFGIMIVIILMIIPIMLVVSIIHFIVKLLFTRLPKRIKRHRERKKLGMSRDEYNLKYPKQKSPPNPFKKKLDSLFSGLFIMISNFASLV